MGGTERRRGSGESKLPSQQEALRNEASAGVHDRSRVHHVRSKRLYRNTRQSCKSERGKSELTVYCESSKALYRASRRS